MSSTPDRGDRRDMTLAFDLSALEMLSDPKAVFADAREWSQHVGVVGNDTDAVGSFIEQHELQQDFELGDADKWFALQRIYRSTNTNRYVFVSSSLADEELVTYIGWESIPVSEAAEKAGWPLRPESTRNMGLVEKLRSHLPF